MFYCLHSYSHILYSLWFLSSDWISEQRLNCWKFTVCQLENRLPLTFPLPYRKVHFNVPLKWCYTSEPLVQSLFSVLARLYYSARVRNKWLQLCISLFLSPWTQQVPFVRLLPQRHMCFNKGVTRSSGSLAYLLTGNFFSFWRQAIWPFTFIWMTWRIAPSQLFPEKLFCSWNKVSFVLIWEFAFFCCTLFILLSAC